MSTDEQIERFHVPTLAQLAPLKLDDDTAAKVIAVLNRHASDPSFDHEDALQECDALLDTSGVVSLDIEDARSYTDEGIRMCPPFSYCNAGDTYVATLARDHEARAWVIACWGDLHEEYCKAHEIGDYEVFDERPEMCPSCHDDCFSLEFFPGSARGPAYSWFCDACNHHCFAASDGDAITIGEDEDGHLVQVVAIKVGERTIGPGSTIGEYRFEVRLEGVAGPCPDYKPPRDQDFATAQEAHERFHAVHEHRAELDAEDDDPGVEPDDDDGGDVPRDGG